MSSTNTPTKKTPKPCPRCGSAAGKGNGGSQCQCKKGKPAAIVPNTGPSTGATNNTAPAPCDAPLTKTSGAKDKGDCGCS